MIWMDVDTALSEVPVNVMPLIDDTDFKSRETTVAYNATGMDLVWNFVTSAGAFTQTAVTPTTAGDYDWTNQGDGMYTIEIPASGGASINNDTEGYGWFSGVATGILPWRGPIIGFRDSGLNDLLTDNAYSATRGLAGTALPAAAADAAGGLPISDAGGLDLDTKLAATNEVTAARMGALTDWINGGRLDLLLDAIKAVTDNLPDSGALTSLAQAAALATAQTDLDTLTGTDGATLATSQPNYAPATAAAMATVDANVDAILADTGTDGVVVAAASKTGYSLTATTGLGNQTANITGNLSGSVGSVTGAVGSVTGAVGSVTGNVGGSVASVASGGITAASFGAGAIDAVALASDASAEIVAALLAATIEGSVTLKQSLALSNAAAAGKLSGAATTSVALRNLADSLNRIAATVDADGNRSAVTTNFTDL